MRNKILLRSLAVISLALPLFLFSYTALNSWGYDDEIFNIRHVESYDSLYSLMKAHLSGELVDGRLVDIHPLGQYVINFVLLKVLGSWNLVRLAGALIASLSLWLFWRYLLAARKWTDKFTVLLSYLLICLNPSMLLWCTGVRWYTYFMPLVCLIGVLFEPPEFLDSRKSLFWGTYFVTVSLMFYIETSASIMIALSFALLLIQRRAKMKREIGTVIVFGLLSIAFVSRQIYILLTVIFPRVVHSGEFYSLLSSFIGGGQNFLSGHAVVPVSVPGLLLIAANLVIFLAFIVNFRGVMLSWRNKFFVLSYIALIVAKIGGKIRNFISTSALLGEFSSDVFSRIRNSKLKAALICLYLAGNIWGIHNVILHTDTAKGSWNTPYSGYDAERECPVISHDPVFSYHAQNRGFNVIWADNTPYDEWYGKVIDAGGKVIVLETFRGSMPRPEFEKFNAFIKGRKVIHEERFGYDKFAGLKRRFDKDCPDYYAVILVTE